MRIANWETKNPEELKRQLAILERFANDLERRLTALTSELGVLTSDVGSISIPTTLPPTGPAGGDLAGTYPNPDIAAGAIVDADVNAAAQIALSKLADIGTNRLLGRDAAGVGPIENIFLSSTLVMSAQTLGRAAISGDVTINASSNTAAITAGVVVDADVNASAAIALSKLQTITTDRLLGRDTAGTGAIEQLTVGGGVEFSGAGGIQRSALSGDVTAAAGSNATSIAPDLVGYAQHFLQGSLPAECTSTAIAGGTLSYDTDTLEDGRVVITSAAGANTGCGITVTQSLHAITARKYWFKFRLLSSDANIVCVLGLFSGVSLTAGPIPGAYFVIDTGGAFKLRTGKASTGSTVFTATISTGTLYVGVLEFDDSTPSVTASLYTVSASGLTFVESKTRSGSGSSGVITPADGTVKFGAYAYKTTATSTPLLAVDTWGIKTR